VVEAASNFGSAGLQLQKGTLSINGRHAECWSRNADNGAASKVEQRAGPDSECQYDWDRAKVLFSVTGAQTRARGCFCVTLKL
jgi:hypothetical protein